MTHIHKYKRKKIGKKGWEVYLCTIPGCTHHVTKDLILGRKALCYYCNREFIITNPRLVRQHCIECTRGNKLSDTKLLDGLTQILNKVE